MKTVIKGIMGLIVIAGLSLSCKDKETTVESTETTIDSTSDTLATLESDTLVSRSAGLNEDVESADVSTQTTTKPVSKTIVRSKSTTATTAKPPRTVPNKKLEGFSAPDGTDAENHDGDPYTKHDTTPMPSGGVPIK